MTEEWRWVVGWEGKYQVSNLGNVASYSHHFWGRPLTPNKLRSGHLQVTLKNKAEQRKQNVLVHRMVLEAFVGPCPEGMEARHLDGNPVNNILPNLEWGTHLENSYDQVKHGVSVMLRRGEDAVAARLSNETVAAIRAMYKIHTVRYIARHFDVSVRHVRDIVNWKARRSG